MSTPRCELLKLTLVCYNYVIKEVLSEFQKTQNGRWIGEIP